MEEATVSDIATEAGVLRDFILANWTAPAPTSPNWWKPPRAPASTVRWHLMKLRKTPVWWESHHAASIGDWRRYETCWFVGASQQNAKR